MNRRLTLMCLAVLIALQGFSLKPRAGDFERLYYDSILGTPMLNLRNSINGTPTDPNDALYPDFPLGASMAEVVPVGIRRIEQLSGTSADNFATLIRAYVQAPMDGSYKFFIASDDTSEFYISADHTPLNIRGAGNFLSGSPAPAAFETGCCTPLFTGDRLADRSTDPITLQKGKFYYFEFYQKEGGGGAWAELGWQRPDGVQERIPATAIFPFVYPESGNFPTATGVTVNPVDQTVTEVSPVTFAVSGVFAPPVTFQWLENGTPIPGATLAAYTIPQTSLAMNGRKYSVQVNGVATPEATLTVDADATPLSIVSAYGSGVPHGIIVVFNKPVDTATATATANYSFTGQTLTISSAQLLAPNTVLLKTGDFTSTPLSVKINNVKDRTTAGNVIPANTTANVNLAMPNLAIVKLFTGLTRGTDGGGASEAQRTRDLANYPNSPDFTGQINGINVPQTGPGFGPGTDLSDFQTFVRGYIVAPESGDYTIYISSDDPSALYLSPDDNFANLPAIDTPTLWEDGCCRALGTVADGLNTTVTLVAGKYYAFEAYAAEYGGGDYLQVGWSTPSDPSVVVIPSSALASEVPSGALTFTTQPASKTALENTSVTFSTVVAGTPSYGIAYQWYRNGQPIAGATGSSYTINAVQVADSGAKFSVHAVNRNGTYNELASGDATLTVSTDNLPPNVLKIIGSRDYNKVTIVFDEPVDATTAQTIGNYTVQGLQVTGAVLSADGRSVTLSTSTQAPRTRYNVTVNNVADIISPNNKIANFQGNFLSWDIARGWITFEAFKDIGGSAAISGLLTATNKFPDRPDEVRVLNSFDTPNGYAEAYGARVRGWFYPPETGDYRLFIRSDDASQLYFNPDGAAEVSYFTGAAPVAEETGCCGNFMPPDSPETTAVFHLTNNVPYYIEALLKEGGGGDWMQVAYRLETDTTDPAALRPIPGSMLGAIIDVDVNLQITQQPTDQVGVVPSPGISVKNEDFNATDGGFTVETVGDVPGPWVYDAAGNWRADSGNDGCGTPQNTALISPDITLAQSGALTISFNHRYSFEPDFDGGQVRVSVNGGAFTEVPAANFRQNGYSAAGLQGNGVFLNKRAFNGNSAGYGSGQFITSVASLGTFKQGDVIKVEFLAAWDECTTGTVPGWQIDSMRLDLLPMTIQDFAVNNGNYTVETNGDVPNPWAYDATAGAWIAKNGNDGCANPGNSWLKSPAYVVPQDDEVTLNFRHRYSFEQDYDGGQIRISVNGGPFTTVTADKFIANGYASTPIAGNGIMINERAFSGDSAGYASSNLVTSTAVLGSFKKNDTIVVAFVGAWDECSTGQIPSWTIKDMSLAFGKAAQASTFTVAGTGTLHGDALALSYQWQRNDGSGFVDILGANGPSFTIYPTTADLAATFRVIVSAPGATATSSTVKLTSSAPAPTIAVTLGATGPSITFTGRLQSATTVNGTYSDVQNATNPYTPPAGTQMLFFRSVQ